MESAPSSSSPSASSDALIQNLISRGWCFGDIKQVTAVIANQLNLHGDSCTVDLIETELCNMDLRSIGGKSLPDPSLFRKSSHFHGPKVLQIASSRDISQHSIAGGQGNSKSRRLLRLKLTDGHSEIIAIEYSHIPSIPDRVIPGTKVRLENKAFMRDCMVCLTPEVISVLGGVVQSLYEEWEMNQKYSGFSRSSLNLPRNGETDGPPPFEKFQVGASSDRVNQQAAYPRLVHKDSGPTYMEKGGMSGSKQTNDRLGRDFRADSKSNDLKLGFPVERTGEKESTSESRPKEVAEFMPVQNQAAAQKLLQKMSDPNKDDRHARGRRQRGKGKEESAVLTLDEWERKKAGESSMAYDLPNISQDEDLARHLQDQFDLEDLHVQRGHYVTDEDELRMSMFSFERDDPRAHVRTGFRGRGRGRSQGRGRGRGRYS